ncbi:cytochrome P450 [Micromonospora sp. NPDC050495]|uniref:cytochrome P450 n=1 Tax=Micromonospora sp. NPDC050495 TaxID=3154936 RepID=UPI00340D6ABA
MSDVDVAELPAFPFLSPRAQPFIPVGEPDLARLDGPVTRVRLPFGGWAWLVTRHADVRALLRAPGLSSNPYRPGFPVLNPIPPEQESAAGAFIYLDGVEHSRLRKMLLPEFMLRNIRRIEPLIEQTVVDALERMRAAGPPADLISSFALPVTSMTICHLLGVPYAEHERFQRQSLAIMDRASGPAEINAALADLGALMFELIQAKRVEPGDDLLSRLTVDHVVPGELGVEELLGIGMLLLIAGHETTANMIGLSVLALLEHPEHLAALRDDPERAPDLVEELLRYLTVVRAGLPRLALEDIEIGGQRIRAGEGVVAMLPLANRDPAVFPDGDRLDPGRADVHQHLAFGFGVHQCIGQPLARAELRIALVELARRLPDLRCAVPAGEVPWRPNAVTFGLAELPVTWATRAAPPGSGDAARAGDAGADRAGRR